MLRRVSGLLLATALFSISVLALILAVSRVQFLNVRVSLETNVHSYQQHDRRDGRGRGRPILEHSTTWSVLDDQRDSYASDTPAISVSEQERWPRVMKQFATQARRRFQLWDQVNPDVTESIGADIDKSVTEKYLIYRCDSRHMAVCGGLADRIKGIMMGYLIANLTGRLFKAEILLPSTCDLRHHLVPHQINWTLVTSFHPELDGQTPDSKIVDVANDRRFYRNVSSTNLTALLGPARYVYFKANLDYSQGLRESKIYGQQLAWMSLASPHQVQATIYRRLFKLAPPLQIRLQSLLARELPSSEHRLICAHIRTGRNPTNPHDYEVRVKVKELESVWTFISNQSIRDQDRVFIMADSDEVMRLAERQSFSSRQITTPGVIRHIDLSGNLTHEVMCSAQEKLIFDLHLLMNCDVVLVSNSGLSRLAAYVRGIDQGLYCLTSGGKIIPCTMDTLKTIYNVMG